MSSPEETTKAMSASYKFIIALVFLLCVLAMWLVLSGKWHLSRFSDDSPFNQEILPKPFDILPKIINEDGKTAPKP